MSGRNFRQRVSRLQVERLEERDVPATISGAVFEDLHYGGGPGRSFIDSDGVGRPGVRVELYDAAGSFLDATTTDPAGSYLFDVPDDAVYAVRIVNSTVTSSRPGSMAGLWPVQTFRTDAASGTAVPVTNEVGGSFPSGEDSGGKAPGDHLGDNAVEQSVGLVSVAAGPVGGVDFGFNFDAIVNTNDAGQGSLRQFIQNSNELGAEESLAQAGLPAGFETSVFRVPEPSLINGVAVINLMSGLPLITGVRTHLDGTTQTNNIGDTNPGSLGAGGSVGVDELPLLLVPKPEVLIRDGNNLSVGLVIGADAVAVRGLAIHGFGSSDFFGADIRIQDCAGVVIEHNVVGFEPFEFTSPVDADRSSRFGILVGEGDNGVIRNNLVGFTGQTGILLTAGAMGWTIEGNEVRDTSWARLVNDGISIEADSGGAVVRGNLVVGNRGHGIDTWTSAGRNTIANNTVHSNGRGGIETNGIHLQGELNEVIRNRIFANYGAGVGVAPTSLGNLISQNSIFGNGTPTGQIGIDLLSLTDSVFGGTFPFVTPNDFGDVDNGGNGLVNAPVLEQAQTVDDRLRITGWARPDSVVDFFVADPDPTHFGEGKTYLISLVEGAGNDHSTDVSTYGPVVNGLHAGRDFTNRFVFEVPLASLPELISDGTTLTATATVGHSTSEFSGNVIVNAMPVDLVVTQRATQRKAVVRSVITVVTTVRNRGPGLSQDVLLLQTLPKGLRLLSAAPSQGTFDFARRSWSLGPLPAGRAATLKTRVRITSAGEKIVRTAASAVLSPELALDDNTARLRLTGLVKVRSGWRR